MLAGMLANMLAARRAVLTTILAVGLSVPSVASALDRDAAERAVVEAVGVDLGRPVRSATCPDVIPQELGASIACEVTGADDTRASATATVTPDGLTVDFALLAIKLGETTIARAVRKQAGTAVHRVDCPDLVPIEAGGRFECVVVGGDRSQGTVTVRQKDDLGNISFSAPVLHVREAERSIARQIRDQTGIRRVRVNCQDIVMAKKGNTFVCTGTSAKGRFAVDAKLTNDQGRFRFKTRSR